jgi:hypothetical protein
MYSLFLITTSPLPSSLCTVSVDLFKAEWLCMVMGKSCLLAGPLPTDRGFWSEGEGNGRLMDFFNHPHTLTFSSRKE